MAIIKDDLRQAIPETRMSEDAREEISKKVRDDLNNMQIDRADWLNKYEEFLYNWNDYVSPNRVGVWDNSSNFHVPFTMQQMRGIHARLLSMIFDIHPWFYIKTDKKVSTEKKKYHEVLMQWTLESLSNRGEGIFDAIDTWIWKGLELGSSWLRIRWEEHRETFVDVEDEIDPMTGEVIGQREVEVEKVIYAGPAVEVIDKLNFYVQPGQPLAAADPVICRLFWSADDLKRLKNNPQYDAQAIDELLDTQPQDNKEPEQEKHIAQLRSDLEGVKTVDQNLERPAYRILEAITNYDINGDGIAEKLVIWMDEVSGIIIGWNYANRLHINGRLPYYKFTFIPRDNEDLGLVELLYQTNVEIDAMHNMRVDAGTLLNLPWGTRKNRRGIKADDVRIAPGRFIDVEEHDDIQIKSLPNTQPFFVQEEEMLKRDGEKLGLSSLAFSQMPDKVGALGTASGAMAMLNEGDKILNVHIKRLQRSWRQVLKGIYDLVRMNLPEGTKFRVTGETNEDIHYALEDRTWLLSDVDFHFTANTASLNKEAEKQAALIAHQTLLNPLHIQVGAVTPKNILMSLKDVLRTLGKSNVMDYLNEQVLEAEPISLTDEINSILMGQMPPIVLNDDHEAKIAGLSYFLNGIEMNHYQSENPQLAATLERLFTQVIQKHQEMLDAIQAQAQTSNISGLQIAPTQMNRSAGLGTSQESQEGQPAPVGGGNRSPQISGGSDTES